MNGARVGDLFMSLIHTSPILRTRYSRSSWAEIADKRRPPSTLGNRNSHGASGSLRLERGQAMALQIQHGLMKVLNLRWWEPPSNDAVIRAGGHQCGLEVRGLKFNCHARLIGENLQIAFRKLKNVIGRLATKHGEDRVKHHLGVRETAADRIASKIVEGIAVSDCTRFGKRKANVQYAVE